MPLAVLVRSRRLQQGDELVAHVDERLSLALAAQGELENLAVEGERLFHVADLSNKSLTGTLQRLLAPPLRLAGSNAPVDSAGAVVRWLGIGLLAWAVVNHNWAWYWGIIFAVGSEVAVYRGSGAPP